MSYKTYEKYKNSNVEWIGDIPIHWQTNRFKIVFSYSKGKNPQTFFDDPGEGLAPYLSMEYLRNDIAPTYVPIKECPLKANNGDLLLLWDGSNAGEFVVSKEGLVSSTMAKLKPNIIIDNDFYKYVCKAFELLLRELTIGMGVPHVSSLELNNILLPAIPLEEQQQIANYLDKKTAKIDATIAKNEELIQLLEEKRVALINQVVTKGLNPDVPMKDSGVEWIGEIHEHWDVVKLKFCTNVINDKKDFADKDDKYIGLEHIESETGILLDYSNEGADGTVNKFKKDMVLFGKLRPYLAKVINTSFNGVCSTELLVFKTNESLLSRYLFYFMLSNRFIEQVNSSTYGVKMPRASPDFINSLPIALPNTNEQKEVVDYLDSEITNINNTILKIKENIALLEEYKTSLIHHVVTGKIDVRGEEI